MHYKKVLLIQSTCDMKILIVNGPNLNLLGQREPGIYGSSSFESYLEQLRKQYADVEIDYFQSNIEGELINKLPLDERLHEIGKFTREQVEEYFPQTPIKESHKPITPIKVDYKMEDLLARGWGTIDDIYNILMK